MRVLGYRWGLVMAIIGFPILGRGIYMGDTLLLSIGIVSHRNWDFALGLPALSSQDQHAPTTDQLSCLSPFFQYGRVSSGLATSHDLASCQ